MNIRPIALLILVIVATSFAILYRAHQRNKEGLIWQDNAVKNMNALLISKN